jgi:transmembrane sensor
VSTADTGAAARAGEAAEWLVRLQQDDVAEADVAAWLRWCAADNANLEAFEGVQALYDQLQALAPSDRKSFLKFSSDAVPGNTRDWLRRLRSWSAQYARPLYAGAAAASVAVVITIVGLHARSPLAEAHDYRAEKGMQQAVLLSDHSQVTLASASELVSHFTPKTRFVDLRQGEAYFQVQHDATRPFVVHAGGMTVTAVGTKFNVRTSGGRTVVAVTEGAVDVTADVVADGATGDSAADAENNTTPVRLKAGQQAARQADQAGLMVVDVRTDAAAGWRQGRLEYVMEPLGSVVENVNRYASRRIVIEDAPLASMLFTGTVFVDRVDDWAMTLPASFPISTSVAADGTLTLKLRGIGRSGVHTPQK